MQKIRAFAAYMAMFTTVAHAYMFLTDGSLPTCAAQCIADSLSMSSDAPANDAQLCANKDLSDSLERCVSTSCTIREFLTTKNTTESICRRPLRNRSKAVSIPGVIGISLALPVFILRLLARIMSLQFGMDDWAMIAAMGFVIPLSAMAVVLADCGLGKDVWSIPFGNITYILHIYYFDELLYLGSLTMVRVSILCLYLRIFPQKTFKSIVHAVVVGNTLYGTVFILISIFQCIPVRAAWTRWDGTVGARCVNANALGWTSGAINIALDVIILVLPMPGLAKLVMPWERKIHILMIFGLGSFVAIVAILRLTSLVKFANTQNITWDYVPVGYWSTIEVHVSVICACLPALPSLFRKRPQATPIGGPTALSGKNVRPISQPKNRDSDVLPLLKVASVHRRGMSD